jgi:DNA-binding NarL/FixJ family response regulator
LSRVAYMEAISIAIVEDNQRYANSLKRFLSKNSLYDRIDIYETIKAYMDKRCSQEYDIILLDIQLPDGCGIDIIGEIKRRSPSVEIIMLTAFSDEDRLFKALKLGASGYITKENSLKYIQDSIIEVLGGGAVISPDMAKRFLNYFIANKRESTDEKVSIDLSREEIEVIEILARGLTNREISEALKIRYRYVKTILSKIYKKFGTSSRAEVVRRAVEMGIVKI